MEIFCKYFVNILEIFWKYLGNIPNLTCLPRHCGADTPIKLFTLWIQILVIALG